MRYVLAIAVVMAASLVAFFAFGSDPQSKATLTTSKGTYTFNIEIADTDDERAQGLMNREHLADNAGMLFDFQQERHVAFWMKNTLILLDMIFIGADGTVKTIHENAFPHDETSIPSRVPVRFVLEIPGGRSREIGLKPGDKLSHPLVEE